MADEPLFITTGKQTGTIPVRISLRIIELFSEGLYQSPHKAVEELVANAFDAGARNVHVIMSPDRSVPEAFIAVVDDGEGMDEAGLRQHWLIGVSNKRNATMKGKRKQIGRFGIGKLATFVLGRYLTHICKRGSRYFATTMDYETIPHGEDKGIYTKEEDAVPLSLRELTEKEARAALEPFMAGEKPGYEAVPLFGKKASHSWTVAVMSGLKEMARLHLQKGRLAWVLRTAMPLRDDFKLFLDGDLLEPAKVSQKPPVHKWVLGKDILGADKRAEASALDDVQPTEVPKAAPEHRYGLTHPSLGRITGYAEVYQDFLTEGKSTEVGRSHGFFVYVRGRLINLDDPLFGIKALRHGTFAKFRLVVNIDNLDEELRSSRETVRDGPVVIAARSFLNAVFNIARLWLEKHERTQDPGAQATRRIADSPGSLTRRPILSLARKALAGEVTPQYLELPPVFSAKEQAAFLADLEKRSDSDEGLVSQASLVELGPDRGIALFDVANGTLKINALHPFVAANRADYESRSEPFTLLAMADVLTEAYLYQAGLDQQTVRSLLGMRDELLREFARSLKRTPVMVAQALLDAVGDKNRLEQELVACFDSMGFDAVPIGKAGEPDGKAVAALGMQEGKQSTYSLTLEAKSKKAAGKPVAAKDIDVAAVIRHREKYKCEHAVVVAPEFPTGSGADSAIVKDAAQDRKSTGKSITFIRAYDLARLVRHVTSKCVTLDRLRDLFQTCSSPEEAAAWIDRLEKETPESYPHADILKAIWDEQRVDADNPVAIGSIRVRLRDHMKIKLNDDQLFSACKAFERLAPTHVAVRGRSSVELRQRPDIVLAALKKAMKELPEGEQKRSAFKL